MIDEQIILGAERLRDGLADFRKLLRTRYASPNRQVTSDDLKKSAATLAETWLVQLAPDDELAQAIGPSLVADLTVHFQRILTYTEHATTRARYDAEIKSVLDNYASSVVVPLKRARGRTTSSGGLANRAAPPITSAFIGQSFASGDEKVNTCVRATLEAIGIRVVTGEKPKADSIADKVKRLIDDQPLFVGIFTRRDKISRKNEFTTSSWVIDEKAYATGRRKRLVLVKEQGVESIGGIQGDYEYIEFSRDALEKLSIGLLQLFDITHNGLRK